jgi:ubiquinone biosynthesis protein
LVQERIKGIPINDLAALDAAGIDRAKLASTGVKIFLTQVFRDSFFHADMHPGNIFVNPKRPKQPQYIAVDFGIMGSLTTSDQAYLARILLAFFKRDYRQIAQLHVDCGWLPKDTPINEFESVIRSFSEPIFAQPLGQISFAQVLLGLFHTARRFNMEIQPQLVLLQKTLLNIEGLGRQLYPQLDLWKTAQPILEQWVKQQIGPRQVLQRVYQQWPDLAWQLPQLPSLVYQSLKEPQSDQSQPTIGRGRYAPGFGSMVIALGCVGAGLWLMPISIAEAFTVAPYSLVLGVSALILLWRR